MSGGFKAIVTAQNEVNMRTIALAALVAFLTFLVAGDALAEKRVALVIGNSEYELISPLANPENDARLMAGALRDVGFEVVEALNADRSGMIRAMREFGAKLAAAGADAVGLFFYAGHGVQALNSNFLLPLGANINTEEDLELDAVDARWVLRQMERARNRLNIVVLDACRNNPFRGAFRSASRGLGRIEAPSGSLIAYSAAPGQVAADGNGANSPYTAALAEAIRQAGSELIHVFRQTRIAVEAQTGGAQTPWEEQSLKDDFYFLPGAIVAPLTPGTAPDAAAWTAIQNTQSRAVLETFIEKFPDSLYAEFARARLIELEGEPDEDRVAVGVYPEQPQPTGQYRTGDEFRDCDDCPEMVVVPAGSFMMGSPADEDDRRDTEGPQHTVTIPQNFAVGRFEVTFFEWDAFCKRHARAECGHHPSGRFGRGRQPVLNISWDHAKAYVAWLSRTTGEAYRLLSEAEWEYAARAGTTTPFSTGNFLASLEANHRGLTRYLRSTAVVGQSDVNGFGLFDMHGNVSEWVEDCWNDSYAGAPDDGSARMSGDCTKHVLRGGSWKDEAKDLRSASRYGRWTVFMDELAGFRVARTLSP